MRFARGATTATTGALMLLLGLTPACAKDDGGNVRNVGGGEASGSASGTGSGSGSGTGHADVKCVPVGDAASASTRVLVKMNEFTVSPADPSAPAGKINFHVENAGKEPHELVVVKDTQPDPLPTGEDGSVDEDKLPEGAFIGEVEPFSGGLSCDGTFDLPAGGYVLFCNIVEEEPDGTKESHYQEGMRAVFTVS